MKEGSFTCEDHARGQGKGARFWIGEGVRSHTALRSVNFSDLEHGRDKYRCDYGYGRVYVARTSRRETHRQTSGYLVIRGGPVRDAHWGAIVRRRRNHFTYAGRRASRSNRSRAIA